MISAASLNSHYVCQRSEKDLELKGNLHRYEKQVRDHIHYLDEKLGRLNEEIERAAGGVLDDRDAAADLRDRLQRELEARELVT